jgi:hypothetical protein
VALLADLLFDPGLDQLDRGSGGSGSHVGRNNPDAAGCRGSRGS